MVQAVATESPARQGKIVTQDAPLVPGGDRLALSLAAPHGHAEHDGAAVGGIRPADRLRRPSRVSMVLVYGAGVDDLPFALRCRRRAKTTARSQAWWQPRRKDFVAELLSAAAQHRKRLKTNGTTPAALGRLPTPRPRLQLGTVIGRRGPRRLPSAQSGLARAPGHRHGQRYGGRALHDRNAASRRAGPRREAGGPTRDRVPHRGGPGS